ncbi:hypothetical protein [Azospirillum canadense]|uniref:hypothetical protein n=1 Tax=Azospirillum canadense TaxID=403962 RepID=UPI002227F918|nr:hypothetical protein [Azospirillum canadense]MCW2236955.1 hypothetical protein [Azospirillum canadense]
MLRTMTFATLTVLALAAPAQAQKQEYPQWMFDEMVPTGPFMRHMDEAQPVPGARPSHWGAMGKNGEFRAGMPQYGTDNRQKTPSYARTQSLTPPVRDGRATANTGGELTNSVPREVTVNPDLAIQRSKAFTGN